MWNFGKYIKQCEIKQYIHNDTLRIQCTIAHITHETSIHESTSTTTTATQAEKKVLSDLQTVLESTGLLFVLLSLLRCALRLCVIVFDCCFHTHAHTVM